MSYSAYPTRLPLDEAVRILQINPGHFHTGSADPIAFSPCSAGCDDFWCETGWQSGNGMARSSLAYGLLQAETAIAALIGQPLTPERKTKILRPSIRLDPYNGLWVTLDGHCGQWWPQQMVPLGTAAVELVDEDGDGYEETGKLTIALDADVEHERLLLYAGGHAGEELWRIRPRRRCTYVAGELVIELDSLQLLLRERQVAPTCTVLNLLDNELYLEEVELALSSDDNTVAPVRFVYEVPDVTCGNPLCGACGDGVINGLIEFQERGERVQIWPATYDAATAAWVRAERPECGCTRIPSAIMIDYFQSYCPPTPLNELSEAIKWPVALLAGARLQVGKCECECATGQWFRSLQQDLATVTGAGRYVTQNRLNYPLGTLRGEQMAYDALATALGWRAKTSAGLY